MTQKFICDKAPRLRKGGAFFCARQAAQYTDTSVD
jgi:hypothetical protein